MDAIATLKKLLGDENLVIGTDVTLKELRNGNIKTVYLSSNCASGSEEEIRRYPVEVVKLDVPNDEVGVICRKRFPISVISVKK